MAVRDPSGSESLREYQPATGAYGAVLATDSSGSGGYGVLGVDGAAQRALVLHWRNGGTWSLATYDTSSGKPVADVPGPAGEQVLGGRVDSDASSRRGPGPARQRQGRAWYSPSTWPPAPSAQRSRPTPRARRPVSTA